MAIAAACCATNEALTLATAATMTDDMLMDITCSAEAADATMDACKDDESAACADAADDCTDATAEAAL